MKSKAKPAKSRRDRLKKQSCTTSVQGLEKDILLFKRWLGWVWFFLTATNKGDNPLNPTSEFALHKGEPPPKKSVVIWFIWKASNYETYGQKSSATSWCQDKHKNSGKDPDLRPAGLNLKLERLTAAECTGGLHLACLPTPTVSTWCWMQEWETLRQAHKSELYEETRDHHRTRSWTGTMTDLI